MSHKTYTAEQVLDHYDEFFVEFYSIFRKEAWGKEERIRKPRDLPPFALCCWQDGRKDVEEVLRERYRARIALTDRGDSMKIDVNIIPQDTGFRVLFDVWENHAASKDAVNRGIEHA